MKSLLFAVLGLILPAAANAADFPLTGSWKLQSVVREVTGGAKSEPYGAHPEGILVFTPDSRMIGIIVPSATDSQGKDVPQNLVAYSGPYTTDKPGQVSYHVDISISKSLTPGAVTTRTYTLNGDTVILATLPAKGADGAESRTLLTWKRTK